MNNLMMGFVMKVIMVSISIAMIKVAVYPIMGNCYLKQRVNVLEMMKLGNPLLMMGGIVIPMVSIKSNENVSIVKEIPVQGTSPPWEMGFVTMANKNTPLGIYELGTFPVPVLLMMTIASQV